MKVIKHPELKKIFRKLDVLWYNRRLVGVHKRDVENILLEAFENIPVPHDKMWTCPICDYDKLLAPPRNHEICSCCGTEFGYDDFHKTNHQLREDWVLGGCMWWSTYKPDDRGVENDIPKCDKCHNQMTHVKTEESVKLYICSCQLDVGIVYTVGKIDTIPQEGFDD